MTREILVYFQRLLGESIPAGLLRAQELRGKEVFSFEASAEWIEHTLFRFLDPDLGQFSGPQHLRDDKPNFGLFLDSSPDRWGRLLIRRREALCARQESRPTRHLYESDFLLGVFDGNRMGALRFKLDASGNFLDDNAELAAPPLARLRELEEASLSLEQEDAPDRKEYSTWLRMLIAPGSSLGGARPKANVTAPTGDLWIAKFPSRADAVDQGAWEAVTLELARRCGLCVSKSRCERFGRHGHTFLTQRFDRVKGQRIHFASAMTLLGHQDGTGAAEGSSYLELVEWILRYAHSANRDLYELWHRIVFSIAISNTDDHLRNHGFLLSPHGWELSPAYDLNPDPEGTGLALNISESDNALDFDLALEVAPYFRVSLPQAKEIRDAVLRTVADWRSLAQGLGIPRREQEFMETAFHAK